MLSTNESKNKALQPQKRRRRERRPVCRTWGQDCRLRRGTASGGEPDDNHRCTEVTEWSGAPGLARCAPAWSGPRSDGLAPIPSDAGGVANTLPARCRLRART